MTASVALRHLPGRQAGNEKLITPCLPNIARALEREHLGLVE
jgi:hypothetical protein